MDQNLDNRDKLLAELEELRGKARQLEALENSRLEMESCLNECEEKIRMLSLTDDLTGLFVRHHFMTLLEKELERTRRYDRPISLLLYDLDHMKFINDSFGQEAGDRILSMTARIAQSLLRKIDIQGRISGDRFAAILPETGKKSALLVAERLRSAVEEMEVDVESVEKFPLRVTISVGVVTASIEALTRESLDKEALFKGAEMALYAAKQNGRNKVEDI